MGGATCIGLHWPAICCLNKRNAYCKTWQPTVNNDKTKVDVFNKTGKMKNDSRFDIDGKELETVKEMKYLGINYNNNGTFNSATENLKDKSSIYWHLLKIY